MATTVYIITRYASYSSSDPEGQADARYPIFASARGNFQMRHSVVALGNSNYVRAVVQKPAYKEGLDQADSRDRVVVVDYGGGDPFLKDYSGDCLQALITDVRSWSKAGDEVVIAYHINSEQYSMLGPSDVQSWNIPGVNFKLVPYSNNALGVDKENVIGFVLLDFVRHDPARAQRELMYFRSQLEDEDPRAILLQSEGFSRQAFTILIDSLRRGWRGIGP